MPDDASLISTEMIHGSTHILWSFLGHVSLKSSPREKNVGKVPLLIHSVGEYFCGNATVSQWTVLQYYIKLGCEHVV